MEAFGIESIIILFLLAFIFAGIIVICINIYVTKKANKPIVEKEKETHISHDIEAMKILLADNSVDKINEFIDSLIREAANMYTILTAGKGVERYITDREGEQMQRYIFGMVKRNMTKDVRDVIGLLYNIKEEKDLDEVLQLRIKLYAANVIVKNNLPIE